VWKDVTLPAGKVLMPGLIAHSTNVVEHPESVGRYALHGVARLQELFTLDPGFAIPSRV
jgi:hypothetical protein